MTNMDTDSDKIESKWLEIQRELNAPVCLSKKRNALLLARATMLFGSKKKRAYIYLILDDLFGIVPLNDDVKKLIAQVAEEGRWITLAKSTYDEIKDRAGVERQLVHFLELAKKYQDNDITVTGLTRQQGRDFIGMNNVYMRNIANMEAVSRVQLIHELPTQERLALVTKMIGAGPNIPKGLTVKESKIHGLGLMVERDIKKGETIFEEDAFLWYSTNAFSKDSRFCSSCSVTIKEDRDIHCNECGQEHYCSVTCQKAAPHTERCRCSVEPGLSMSIFAIAVKWLCLMMSRDLRMLEDEKVDIAMSRVLDLDEVSKDGKCIKFGLEDMFKRYNSIVDAAGQRGMRWATMQLVNQIIRRMQRYGFSQEQHMVIPSAYGLFINHSEKPNAGYTIKRESTKTPQLVVHALSDIKAGSEICFSYVPMSCKGATRDAVLASHCIWKSA